MQRETMRTWAEVNLSALAHNFQLAKKWTGKKVMCVIKGDAHGHGAVACGKALEDQGADAFAVACLEEGITLRNAGIRLPILVLGWTPAEFVPELVQYDLEQSVLDEEYAMSLSREAKALEKTLRVHIKLDTGMSRTGIYAQRDPMEAARCVCRIAALPGLDTVGIFTHFAAADVPQKDSYTHWQMDQFKSVLDAMSALGFEKELIRHAGNSATILYHPDGYFDMVRLGVMMYGLYPDGNYQTDGPLRPILTLKSRVAQIKELPAGSCISYGCTAQTSRDTKVAVVAAGYADAYPRGLSNTGAYAVIHGVKCPQIGRVCMDMCMFDITDAQVAIDRGDEVILYGNGGMPMEEVAALADTINCAPLSVLTARVKKIYR